MVTCAHWDLECLEIIYCNSRHSAICPFLAGKMGFRALGLGFNKKTNRKYQALRRWDLCRFSKNLGWEMGIESPVQDSAHVSML